MDAPAPTAVGNLIMILQIVDKRRRLNPAGRGAAAFFLPAVVLSLIKVAALGAGNELLGITKVICVVRLIVCGQSDHCGMMKVIVPQAI